MDPVAIEKVTVIKVEFTFSVCFIVVPVSIVFVTIGPQLDTVALSCASVFYLAMIHGSIFLLDKCLKFEFRVIFLEISYLNFNFHKFWTKFLVIVIYHWRVFNQPIVNQYGFIIFIFSFSLYFWFIYLILNCTYCSPIPISSSWILFISFSFINLIHLHLGILIRLSCLPSSLKVCSFIWVTLIIRWFKLFSILMLLILAHNNWLQERWLVICWNIRLAILACLTYLGKYWWTHFQFISKLFKIINIIKII